MSTTAITNAQEIDLENMPLEELRQLAMQAELDAPAPLRDESGRFVSQQADPDPDPTPQTFKRVIDLGDGSGTQVFEADSADELADKLAEAQKHATIKIRELSKAIKPAEPVKPVKDTRTVEERLEAIERDREWTELTVEWVNETPDFEANKQNGERMLKYMRLEGIPNTKEGLQKAFAELVESGLLKPKAANQDVGDPEEIEETAPEERIARPVAKAPVAAASPRKTASGLSNRRGIAGRVASAATPTEEELETMPLEKLREKTMEYFVSQMD